MYKTCIKRINIQKKKVKRREEVGCLSAFFDKKERF